MGILYKLGFINNIVTSFTYDNKQLNSSPILPYWVFMFLSTKANTPLFIKDIKYSYNLTKQTKQSNLNSITNINSTAVLGSSENVTNTHKNHTIFAKKSILYKLGNSNPLPSYHVNNQINTNFLRYERLYTKLKYSRSPAYDIVSGGAAALLAGFLGFLISEKFGFELVDSGDFYYLFIYIVFLVFMTRPLLNILNVNYGI